MSNLIKAAEELEYVPKETLIQMAQSGDSRFPPVSYTHLTLPTITEV